MKIDNLEHILNRAPDDAYHGDVVSLLLNYLEQGEARHGWQRFEHWVEAGRRWDPRWGHEADMIRAELQAAYGYP